MNGTGLSKILEYVRYAIDMGIIFFLFYKGYKLIVRNKMQQLLTVVIVIGMAYLLVRVLHLDVLGWIFSTLLTPLIIGFFVIFQPEIRKTFMNMGKGKKWDLFSLTGKNSGTAELSKTIESALSAAVDLSEARRGMLVVFLKNSSSDEVTLPNDHSEILDARVSASLLKTIFMHDTALHDGACIIEKDRIYRAGAHLYTSEQPDVSNDFGTRHCAALGTAERTDSIVLVVSEETGAISLAYDSQIHYGISVQEASDILNSYLNVESREAEEKRMEELEDGA